MSPSTAFTGAGLSGPNCIAIDASGDAWVGNDSSLSELSPAGVAISPASGYQGSGGYGIAIDNASDVWLADADNNRVSKFSNNGTALTPSGGFTGGGLSAPLSVAIDGAGSVWLAGGGLSEFSSAGIPLSPAKGYAVEGPQAIAIDGSGNVWLAGTDDFAAVTEFVGIAVPVVTPLSTGVLNRTLGARP